MKTKEELIVQMVEILEGQESKNELYGMATWLYYHFKDEADVIIFFRKTGSSEEYALCRLTLHAYQLLGEKAAKEYPLDIKEGIYITDFEESMEAAGGIMLRNNGLGLGSVKFAREEDRLKALEICGIDKAFQVKCAEYGLGGAWMLPPIRLGF